jgi:multidrug efflux pump subunit AcrB
LQPCQWESDRWQRVMTKIAIENRFVLLWLTLLFAAGGMLIYRDMSLELLPSPPQRSFSLVFLNSRDTPRQNLERKRALVADSLRSLSIDSALIGEADAQVTRFFFSTTMHDPDLEPRLDTLVRKSQLVWGDRSWFRVIALGAEHLPSAEVVVAAVSGTDEGELQRKAEQVASSIRASSAVGNVLVEGKSTALIELTEDPFRRSPGFMISNAISAAAASGGRYHGSVANEGWAYSWLPGDMPPGLRARQARDASASRVFFDDSPAVVLTVFRGGGHDDLETTNAVKTVLSGLSDPKFSLNLVSDASRYIVEAESNVMSNLVVGTLLTCICILIFVRRFWATSLVSISIPLALVLTLPILYILGISRNVMSLAGAALGVGIVVDATLGSLTTFNERMAAGFIPAASAHYSASENQIPLLVTSLSTLAVFMPILMLDGVVGSMFWDLSVTVIVGQVVGFFVSVYLMPGVAAMLHDYKQTHLQISREREEDPSAASDNLFYRSLTALLRRPALGLAFNLVLIGAIASSLMLAPPSEFLPVGDSKEFHALVNFESKDGPEDRQRISDRVSHFLASKGFSERLLRADETKISIMAKHESKLDLAGLNEDLGRIAYPHRSGLFRINPLDPQSRTGDDLEMFFPDNANVPKLREFVNAVRQLPGVVGTRQSWDSRSQFIRTDDSISSLESSWVPPENAPMLGRLLVEPTVLGYFNRSLSALPMMSHLRAESLPESPLLVFNPVGQSLHSLNNDVEFPKALFEGQQSIGLDNAYVYSLGGDFRGKMSVDIDGRPSGAVEADVQALAKEMAIPFEWHPRSAENRDGFLKLLICLLSAVVIIAAIILIQTRSFAVTMVVLFTFLWGPIGSMPGLLIHGESLSASALVGFILLAGTIVNNGILLVDLIGKNRNTQMEPVAACIEAARERALPVIITSLTTVLGTLPLVFETGAGSQMYRGLAIVVVYGTIVSTPISLYGVPSLFLLLSELRELISRRLLRMRITGIVGTGRATSMGDNARVSS